MSDERVTSFFLVTHDSSLTSSKLPKKPHIVLEQQSNIIELVNPRARAINAEAEREAGKLFRIHIRRAQNIRMHHAGPAQLDPARPFADSTAFAAATKATVINFGARLGKGKVRWTKPRFCFGTEQSMNKFGERPFQVRHGNSAIHAETFDLIKHRIVRRVGRITAKDATRRDHPDRRAAALHCMNLHGRSLRSQRKAFGRVERVLWVAGRMPLGNIQCVEIVKVRLDFPIVLDGIAQGNEDVLDPLAH